MSNAGLIEIEVTGPYPCWCHIKYKGHRYFNIHHTELSDLEYVVKKAIQEAKLKLGDDKNEV